MKRVSSLMIGAGLAFGLTACDNQSPLAPDGPELTPPTAFAPSGPPPEGAELLGTVTMCEDSDGTGVLDRCDPNAQVFQDGISFYLVRDNRGGSPSQPPDGVPEHTVGVARDFAEILEVEAVFSHKGRPHVILTGRLHNGDVVTQVARTRRDGRTWAPVAPLADHGSVEVCENGDTEVGLERCDPDGHIYRDGTSFYLLRSLRSADGNPTVSVGEASDFSQILTVFAVFSFEGRPNIIFLGRQRSGAVVTRLGTTDESGRHWAPLVPVYNALPASGTGCTSYDGLPGLETCDDEAVIDVTESAAGIELSLSGDFVDTEPETPEPDGIDETIATMLPSNLSDFQLVAVGFLYGKPYLLFNVYDADMGDRRVMIVTTEADGLNWAEAVDAGALS